MTVYGDGVGCLDTAVTRLYGGPLRLFKGGSPEMPAKSKDTSAEEGREGKNRIKKGKKGEPKGGQRAEAGDRRAKSDIGDRRLDLRAVARRVLSREARRRRRSSPTRRSKLTSIEINGTYYGSQKPESFRKWASEVPDGFVFSVKGRASPPTAACSRRPATRSSASSIPACTELGDRLGPVLWQFAPTKKFDEADFGKFLELLPEKLDGGTLRHVVEVRNDSF